MPFFRLPPAEIEMENLRALASELRSGLGWASHPDLAWALLPQLTFLIGGATEVPEAEKRWPTARNIARSVVKRLGPELTIVDDIGFLATSVQHRRVLAPVVNLLEERLVTARKIVSPPVLSPAEILRASREASELHELVTDLAVAEGWTLEDSISGVVFQAAVNMARARSFARRAPPLKAFVVATQHNTAERAYLNVLPAMVGCTTLYVPHAPAASNIFYEDLPTHRAVLRGVKELELYKDLGAKGLMEVGGDPSIRRSTAGRPPKSATIVYAASSDVRRMLQADASLLLASELTPVDIVPPLG